MNVKNSPETLRNRAIGMIIGGMVQKDVAKSLEKPLRTIQRWWARYRRGEDLKHKAGAGRPTTVTREAKIVISKSLGKIRHSTRKIAIKLKQKGHNISKSTVHRYLKENLGATAYKRPKVPKLTEKQRENRLKFCIERQNWDVEEWKRVLWSDESPFELFHPSSAQNDRVLSTDSSKVPPREIIKNPPKVMVWAIMNHRALSELHFVLPKQMVNSQYYVEEILEKSYRIVVHRTRKTGDILTKKLLPDMSRAIFMQDGAPAHTANRTQEWCRNNMPAFWAKGEWPGNSPDLNPIENLWSILLEKLNEMKPSTNLKQLADSLKVAWKNINPSILENIVAGMPARITKCIQLNGGNIGK